MKYSEITKIKNLIYINKQILSTLFPGETEYNIRKRISFLAKKGKLIRIKKDVYLIPEQYRELKDFPEYLATIACSIRKPSYLSLDYVLRKYDVLTEVTYGFTLVTTKNKAVVVNKLGNFLYKEISENLFTGYKTIPFLNYEYYEATKAKALFDWLYYKADKIAFENKGIDLVEDLRLNLDTFNTKDFKELKSYIPLAKSKGRLNIIINNIIKNAYNNE